MVPRELQLNYLERDCPSCEKPAALAAPDLRSEEAAETLGYPALKPSWHGFFQKKVFFSYARCPDCGLLFCPTFFQNPQLAELYSEMPDNTAGQPMSAMKRTQAGYFSFLEPHLRGAVPLSGGFLEIGADIGLFTELAVARNRFDRFHIVEPNRAVHGKLEQVLGARPHQILTDLFDLSAVPDHSIGLAAMIHLLARILRRRWPAYCLQHPQLFRPSSMRETLGRAGFRTLAVERTYNYFPALYLLEHGLWAAGIKARGLSKVPSPQLPLRLGNILTLARA
jgi:hypothetical protein